MLLRGATVHWAPEPANGLLASRSLVRRQICTIIQPANIKKLKNTNKQTLNNNILYLIHRKPEFYHKYNFFSTSVVSDYSSSPTQILLSEICPATKHHFIVDAKDAWINEIISYTWNNLFRTSMQFSMFFILLCLNLHMVLHYIC